MAFQSSRSNILVKEEEVTSTQKGSQGNLASFDSTGKIVDSGKKADTLQKAGTVVQFDQNAVYGTDEAKETGNITFNFTGAKLGTIVNMVHKSPDSPTFPPQANLIHGSYNGGRTNEIYFHYLSNTKVNIIIYLSPSL